MQDFPSHLKMINLYPVSSIVLLTDNGFMTKFLNDFLYSSHI